MVGVLKKHYGRETVKLANRRMFSLRIINSARFLQMGTESQALYFHLGMRADDDGVVEAYPVIKMLGIAPDIMKILVAKNFVKVLNEDQVCLITDWNEHNTIRADRKINSIYTPMLESIGVPLLEPKPRSDVEDNSKRLGGQSTDGIGKVRLGKDSIGKDRIKREVAFAPPSLEEVSKYCLERKNSINPQNYIDYYTARGWMMGKNKMKDWRAAVRTWEGREKINEPKEIRNIGYDYIKQLRQKNEQSA